jgi:prefoldin subunit 5
MTETPRTNAASWREHQQTVVDADFARELERELAALKAEIAALRAERDEARREIEERGTTVMVRIDGGWLTPSEASRALAALKADVVAEQGYRAAAEEIARRRGEMVDALTAENASLKANGPLAEMWRELESYQPIADRDGHGESWRRMCEERTGGAAASAWASASSASWASAAAAAASAWAAASWASWASSASWASVEARTAAWYASRYAASAAGAIAAIRRAKEVKK